MRHQIYHYTLPEGVILVRESLLTSQSGFFKNFIDRDYNEAPPDEEKFKGSWPVSMELGLYWTEFLKLYLEDHAKGKLAGLIKLERVDSWDSFTSGVSMSSLLDSSYLRLRGCPRKNLYSYLFNCFNSQMSMAAPLKLLDLRVVMFQRMRSYQQLQLIVKSKSRLAVMLKHPITRLIKRSPCMSLVAH